jgi:hypothetical protein
VAFLAGCGSDAASSIAPWLTVPTRDGHARFFPISTTATPSHAAATCNDCHGGFDTFKQFTCLNCHDQATTAGQHPSVPGYTWDTNSCLACHSDGTASFPGHDAIFPVSAGTLHAGISCATCHTVPGDHTPATQGCTSCHAQADTATVHANVGGYTWTVAACLLCHADGQVNLVGGHGPFQIASPAAHFQASCLTCHPGMRTDKPWGADFNGSNDCLSCHAQTTTASIHTSVTGYAYATASCLNCHPKGTADAPADHPSLFPIDAASKHAKVYCYQCHTDFTAPSDAANFACATCHTSLDPSISAKHTAATIPVTDYSATPVMCLRCHADSQVDLGTNHSRGDDTPSGNSNHRKAGCTKCHVDMRTDKPFGADFKKANGCKACH